MPLSIKTTYEKAFKLYKDTYIEMLPIVLLLVISEYFLNRYFQPFEKLALNERILLLFLSGFLNSLFLSIVLWGMYQRYHQQAVGYMKMIVAGGKRSLAIFTYLIVFFVPIVLTFAVVNALYTKEAYTPAVLFFILLLPLSYVIFVGVFFYVAPVLIVNKNYDALSGLKKSWLLVRNNWLPTFQTILILIVLMTMIQFVFFLLLGDYGQMAASLVTFSMWCALMISHCEQLETNSPPAKGNIYGR